MSTVTARWCRVNGVPYVFEPLGMFRPKLRKVALKRALDGTLYRAVPRGAALAIGASELERQELEAVVPTGAGGRAAERLPGPVRPAPAARPLRSPTRARRDRAARPLRRPGRARQGARAPRRPPSRPARGRSARDRRPRRRPRPAAGAARAARPARRGGRVHLLGAVESPLDLYGDADVLALPSAHENFGMVAAEAAAAGQRRSSATAAASPRSCAIAARS